MNTIQPSKLLGLIILSDPCDEIIHKQICLLTKIATSLDLHRENNLSGWVKSPQSGQYHLVLQFTVLCQKSVTSDTMH